MDTNNRKSKRHIGVGVKGGALLLLTFLEGWMACFALTHDRLPTPLGTGTPQWLITLAVVLAVLIPFAWLAVVGLDTDGE